MCQNTLPPELNPLWNWLAEILPAVTDQHESWEITLTGCKNTHALSTANVIETTIRVEISEREHPNAVTRTTTIRRPILIRPRAAKPTAVVERLTVK